MSTPEQPAFSPLKALLLSLPSAVLFSLPVALWLEASGLYPFGGAPAGRLPVPNILIVVILSANGAPFAWIGSFFAMRECFRPSKRTFTSYAVGFFNIAALLLITAVALLLFAAFVGSL